MAIRLEGVFHRTFYFPILVVKNMWIKSLQGSSIYIIYERDTRPAHFICVWSKDIGKVR
jgi:hypothetical protein